MQKSDELAQLGAKIINLIEDAMLFAWRLFMREVTILLSTPWGAQPVKLVVALVLALLIMALVWRFFAVVAEVLASIGAVVSYALAALFLFGVVAAIINWVVRAVPNNLVALH